MYMPSQAIKEHNEFNLNVCVKLLEHMQRFGKSAKQQLETLEEKGYQYETIFKASKVIEKKKWQNHKNIK